MLALILCQSKPEQILKWTPGGDFLPVFLNINLSFILGIFDLDHHFCIYTEIFVYKYVL